MLIRGLRTTIEGKMVSIEFPNSDNVVFTGENKDHICFVIESLLANDLTGFLSDIDKAEYGFKYKDIDGVSQLEFVTGSIVGENKGVTRRGQIPNIHSIRYLGKGKIRSQLMWDEGKASPVSFNMTTYSNVITQDKWVRLFQAVNDILKFEFVKMQNGNLVFCFDTNNTEYSVDAQKLVYLLVAECFLTPDNYKRVIMLTGVEVLSAQQQCNLVKKLGQLGNHIAGIICTDDVFDITDMPVLRFS